MFIKDDFIQGVLKETKTYTAAEVDRILQKALNKVELSYKDVATLLHVSDSEQMQKIYKAAGKIKKEIYGDRIVLFAPLYVSDFCVNNCSYCGYKRDNKFQRQRLSQKQIQEEVTLLEEMGHKRLALEAGEDPINCNIEYVLKAIDTIYSTYSKRGEIRRINVNIAATSVEDYKKLKGADIGTYILFQETYHKPTFERVHANSKKGDYNYHLTAFDRAMEAGLDDVGGGVLFGLADYKYEVLALMMHNLHLEKHYGVGFHTVSVPRLKKAEGMEINEFPHILDDKTFKKVVAILRLALPYTGLILSTRETPKMRKEVIEYGVSQISAGSCTGVNAYKASGSGGENKQFDVDDNRTVVEILKELVDSGHIPSYCTACYRQGRTGEKFAKMTKTGQIQNVCTPNALITFMEFVLNYGDRELLKKSEKLIDFKVKGMKNNELKKQTINCLEKLKNGKKDIFL
ncbi:[FeFe] hydrogenase H-cluster radical SAM maturase HydG [Proteinivorax hydrogeniformans]|uniref:[FeFe] hydrogenase H-cluster radical SAM maturase HydG n=1 Tax=Proteinivorax hydrogeniformans TaxID=1826727 RepID=A0AAU8HXA0_9FIRM